MTIFNFRMLNDEDEGFSRVYEVPADMNIQDFHDFICDDLEYDKTHFASIFLSDEKWRKLQEYTLMDMRDDDADAEALPMSDTLLSEIIKERGDRLMFMFDIFTGRSFFIELQESREPEAGAHYPRIVSAEGNPPPQFYVPGLAGEDSIFDEAFGEFADFDGDEYYDDDL